MHSRAGFRHCAGHEFVVLASAVPQVRQLPAPESARRGPEHSAADLIDQVMLAYNGGRLREACQLLARKMLPDDGFIGMS